MAIHAEILKVRFEDIEIENKDVVEKSLDVVQNEVKRLNRIISQFFNLARVKKTDLNLIKINKIVEDVLTLVSQQAIERNISIKTKLNENVESVYGDPDQLKQVILNIILNAFQAIRHDGETHIRTLQKSSSVIIEIEDNGSGMIPEVKERIFELYFTTKHDGGGIGMAICKNIIEAHEGQIRFESEVGKGTKFIIELPHPDQTKTLKVPEKMLEKEKAGQ